jgi:hypothetical protein
LKCHRRRQTTKRDLSQAYVGGLDVTLKMNMLLGSQVIMQSRHSKITSGIQIRVFRPLQKPVSPCHRITTFHYPAPALGGIVSLNAV